MQVIANTGEIYWQLQNIMKIIARFTMYCLDIREHITMPLQKLISYLCPSFHGMFLLLNIITIHLSRFVVSSYTKDKFKFSSLSLGSAVPVKMYTCLHSVMANFAATADQFDQISFHSPV